MKPPFVSDVSVVSGGRGRCDLNRQNQSDALMVIAGRLTFLMPCHRDPWRFHEEKSELVEELRRLASEI